MRLLSLAVVLLVPLTGCSLLFSSSVGGSGGCSEESCAQAGGVCNTAGLCAITCQPGVCECPEDTDCAMEPAGDDDSLVFDCSQANSCYIRCLEGECDLAEFRCGSGACEVSCLGQLSCRGSNTSCGVSSCALTCNGLGNCQDGANLHCDDAASCSLKCLGNSCASMSAFCSRADSCDFYCGEDVTCNGATLDCGSSENCVRTCDGDEAPCQ